MTPAAILRAMDRVDRLRARLRHIDERIHALEEESRTVLAEAVRLQREIDEVTR